MLGRELSRAATQAIIAGLTLAALVGAGLAGLLIWLL